MSIKIHNCKNGNKYLYFKNKIKVIKQNGEIKWYTKNIKKGKLNEF